MDLILARGELNKFATCELWSSKQNDLCSVDVLVRDLKTFKPNAWLNDTVINAFFANLCDLDGHSTQSTITMSTQWYDFLMDVEKPTGRFNYPWVKRWCDSGAIVR